MKKILFILLISFTCLSSFSQEALYKKKPILSINFMMNDFKTAERLQNNSVQAILRQKNWSKFDEMAPGLAVKYLQGLSDHFDFKATLGGSYAEFNFKNDQQRNTTSNFLLELDANIMGKLLSDKYVVTPYFTAGVGASRYRSSFGAYIPLGVGVQFKLSEESFIFTSGQYRVGITDNSANHFNYSIGFGAPIFGSNN